MGNAFFALVPGDAQRAALERLALAFARAAGGRATRAASLHLTLAFVGEVDDARVPALCALGASLEGLPAPFTLSLATPGSFRHARVAWIAPERPPAGLAMLAQSLHLALAAGGFPVEARRFAPHVTLARRCRDPDEVDALAVTPIAWPVDAFVLWQANRAPPASRAAHGHPPYRELARWRL